MKLLPILFFLPFLASAQEITGKWTTIDDNTGEKKSVIDIFERGGKIYGRIIKIFVKPGDDPDPVCDECPEDDDRFKKKIIGMEILRGLVRSGDEFEQGNILDPEVGKVYRCKLWIEGGDLKVRGFWGPFYRTQTWKKLQ